MHVCRHCKYVVTLIMDEDILSRKPRLNRAASSPHARLMTWVEHSTYSWNELQHKKCTHTVLHTASAAPLHYHALLATCSHQLLPSLQCTYSSFTTHKYPLSLFHSFSRKFQVLLSSITRARFIPFISCFQSKQIFSPNEPLSIYQSLKRRVYIFIIGFFLNSFQ